MLNGTGTEGSSKVINKGSMRRKEKNTGLSSPRRESAVTEGLGKGWWTSMCVLSPSSPLNIGVMLALNLIRGNHMIAI